MALLRYQLITPRVRQGHFQGREGPAGAPTSLTSDRRPK